MTRKPEDRSAQGAAGAKHDQGREARLKAALKANIARRKAQARARDAALPEGSGEDGSSGPEADRQQDNE
jgi:hypothetical protein